MQVQQSFLVLCLCSSSWVTSIRRPLSPVRSVALLENRIQSIRLCPGFKATWWDTETLRHGDTDPAYVTHDNWPLSCPHKTTSTGRLLQIARLHRTQTSRSLRSGRLPCSARTGRTQRPAAGSAPRGTTGSGCSACRRRLAGSSRLGGNLFSRRQ